MSSDPSNEAHVPWLSIALATFAVGVVVTVGLSLVDAPGPPAAPQLVVRDAVDVGQWVPFAEPAPPPDAGLDAR